MLATGCRNVLLVGAETVSRLMDPTDRSTTILFGDGAGAAVIALGEIGEGLMAWDLGCDGSAAALLEIPAGGSRLPTSIETVTARQHYMTDRKSTRLNSSHQIISYAVFCLKKKKKKTG